MINKRRGVLKEGFESIYYKVSRLFGKHLYWLYDSCKVVLEIMPHTCCAYGCTNRPSKDSGISFYRFPADEERKQRWIQAVRRMNWKPTEH